MREREMSGSRMVMMVELFPRAAGRGFGFWTHSR